MCEQEPDGRKTVRDGFTYLGRELAAVPCQCGGYCDRVPCTQEEMNEHGCRSDRHKAETYERPACCARAFVCRVCGRRYAGSAESPDF